MSPNTRTDPAAQPPRQLPLLHAGLAVIAAALFYAPILHLEDGRSLVLTGLAGGWAVASLVLLGVLALGSVLLIAADRVTWLRVLSVDMLVLLALIPVVLGVIMRWQAPEAGVAGFGWGLWAAIALLLARIPLSVWIRTRAARANAVPGGAGTGVDQDGGA